jgi:Fe-S-cluster-containing hydrogenase component 2
MKLAIGAYAWHELPTVYLKPYGNTCLGYALGTVGAVLTVWLLLFGASDEPGRDSHHAGRDRAKNAAKCALCKDLSGGPACVRACPTGAAIRVSPEMFLGYAAK